MRKRFKMLCALAFCAPLLSGCSLDEDDGGADGFLGTGGSGAGGRAPGNAGSKSANSAGKEGSGASAGTGINLGAGTGGGSSIPSVYDGGSVVITDDEFDRIRNEQCAGWESEGEELTSVIELVVDVSSSMNNPAPGNRGQSKWDVTRDALLEAIVGVNGPGLPGSVAVGLLFYPNTDATINRTPGEVNQCIETSAMVPIELLGGADAAHRELLGAAIRDVELRQSTPTHDAYRYALENGLLSTDLPGEKFMLLITDGAPTLLQGCTNASGGLNEVDPRPIVEEITRASAARVRTFLIGSPGSEPNRTWMSTAAVIGGTAPAGCNVNGPDYCHMDMTAAPDFSAALRAGLARVAGAVAPCRYTFAEPPSGMQVDREKINVVLSSSSGRVLVVRDDVGECTQGWQLTENDEIQLCTDTCNQVQSEGGVVVDVIFGCESRILPPR